MLEGINFHYDGIASVDMGLLNVKVSSGMFEETFIPSRDIIEEKITGRDKPYFQGVDYQPLSFNLEFAFEDKYDSDKIREVARWLCQDYYKPFFTSDNPNRIFYCIPVDDSSIIHNGLKQGYLKINMRCNSPYSFSPKYTKENYIFGSSMTTHKIIEDVYTSTMGTHENILITSTNDMQIDSPTNSWNDILSGTTWSDL